MQAPLSNAKEVQTRVHDRELERKSDRDDATNSKTQQESLLSSQGQHTSTTRWIEQDDMSLNSIATLQIPGQDTTSPTILGPSNQSPSPFPHTPTPHNFLDSILNPSEVLKQQPRQTSWGSSEATESPSRPAQPKNGQAEGNIYSTAVSVQNNPQNSARVAFLLRHFSEGPGKW
jgi:hypothetical protein